MRPYHERAHHITRTKRWVFFQRMRHRDAQQPCPACSHSQLMPNAECPHAEIPSERNVERAGAQSSSESCLKVGGDGVRC